MTTWLAEEAMSGIQPTCTEAYVLPPVKPVMPMSDNR